MKTSASKPIVRLDEFLDKSYRLDHSENYEEFLTELGVTRSTRLQAMKSEPTITLTKANENYVLTTSYPEGRIVKVRFKIGERMQRRRAAKGETSSLFQAVENFLIEKQRVDGMTVVVEREFGLTGLTVKMLLKDVKCCRWYNLLGQESVLSYGTETSRRMPLWDAQSWKSYTGRVEDSVAEELTMMICDDLSETCF